MNLEQFFQVVADSLPEIEHAGMKFQIRKPAPDDRARAIAYLKDDQHKALEGIENGDDALTKEQIDAWVAHTSEGNFGAVRLFDLDEIKTKTDMAMVTFRIAYIGPYLTTMSLLVNGNPIPRESFYRMAKVVATTPALATKIADALKSMESGEESPNEQAPS